MPISSDVPLDFSKLKGRYYLKHASCFLNDLFQSIGFGEKERKETCKEAGIFSSLTSAIVRVKKGKKLQMQLEVRENPDIA